MRLRFFLKLSMNALISLWRKQHGCFRFSLHYTHYQIFLINGSSMCVSPLKPYTRQTYGYDPFQVLSSLLLMYPYSHAIQVGWCSRNSGAVASRTISASIYNMFVQASAVISANIYQSNDAPRCTSLLPFNSPNQISNTDRSTRKYILDGYCSF